MLGSSIDDLTFKNYTNTLNGDDNVVLLNPKQSENGYYVETGWATTNKNIDLPNSKTLWRLKEIETYTKFVYKIKLEK